MKRPIPRYEAAVVLNFSSHIAHSEKAVVPDAGTEVSVEYFNGVGYTPLAAKIVEPDTLFVRGCKVRLTPNVGGFYIDRTGGVEE